MADAHHDAAQSYQRRCGKSEFLRSQKRCDGHIPAAHQLTVGLDHHLIPQAVKQQCLMGLCQSQLPGKACIVNGA